MKSDFQISNECEKKHIAEVAGKLGIKEEDLILYGNHKAKIQTKNIKKDIDFLIFTDIMKAIINSVDYLDGSRWLCVHILIDLATV